MTTFIVHFILKHVRKRKVKIIAMRNIHNPPEIKFEFLVFWHVAHKINF